jgi:hypothetical protein
MGKFTSNLRKRLTARLRRPDHVLSPTACLGCGVSLDRAQMSDRDAEEVKPYPGAISVCYSCGHIQAFADDLSFRPLTDEEIVDIAGDPEIVLIGQIRGPLRDLEQNFQSLSQAEIEKRIEFLVEQIAKAERRK